MHIEELQVQGAALVTAVEDCPEIAPGEGSVVTARFVTRQVDVIARAAIVGPNGQVETLEGMIIHPIWSEDRQDWVPLGELQQGETLRAADGPAIVLAVTILNNFVSVFNIEVHGEHVYQVGKLGLLVHNACKELLEQWGKGSYDDVLKNVMAHYRKHGSEVGAVDIDDYMFKGIAAMISRSGRGKPVEGFTEGVRRFTVHGTNRYVDVDTILEKVISYGRKFGS